MSDPIIISTEDSSSIQPILKNLWLPPAQSHKGQNGRLLIVGGSKSFHAASLWSAEVASHFVDIVHYASTEENNEILLSLRKQFRNGIVISQEFLPDYIDEDDALLIGPGMERGALSEQEQSLSFAQFQDLFSLSKEEVFTYHMIKYILQHYPHKKFVFDAAGLQMLESRWFKTCEIPPIITPHQKEFQTVFGIDIENLDWDKKITIVQEQAREHSCVILLKAVDDVITDGTSTYIVKGGNQGLTKGGSGDVLSGLTASLYTKNSAITSSVLAAYLVNSAADKLYESHGYWYNSTELIQMIPQVLRQLVLPKKHESSPIPDEEP